MAINKKHIENLFRQKFSFKDQKELSKYFSREQLNEDARKVIQEQWQNFKPDSEQEPELDTIFYKLYYNINSKKKASSKIRILRWIPQIAAVLVITAGISLYYSQYGSNKNSEIAKIQQVEFNSNSGFRNQFKLPDGSSGWLGYDSKLTFRAENNQRVVLLDGLAFFDVSKKENLPFIIKTPSNLDIEVVGTRLNVASYSQENSCDVVLEEGSINLLINNEEIGGMFPGERVLFNSHDNTIQKSVVNVYDYVAWKGGLLVLNGASLEETCIKLSRFYNIEVDLQVKNLGGRQIRLVLEDETLEEALNLLSLMFPVNYQIINGKILDNNRYSKKKVIIK